MGPSKKCFRRCFKKQNQLYFYQKSDEMLVQKNEMDSLSPNKTVKIQKVLKKIQPTNKWFFATAAKKQV